jgi:iron complex outermembrane receptor protein
MQLSTDALLGKLFISATTLLIGLSPNVEVFAQDVLEEVTVTAQRREENVLDVPVSLSVLSEKDLQGLSDVRELFKVAPTVQFQGGVSSGGQSLSIRGIGGGGFASSFEHSVSVVIDQIATGPSGSALGDFWDVERIEVLNGPQGTLFGKNVSAGLINIVTRNPTDVFEGFAKISYETEYSKTRVDGVLSGPISDNLKARLAVYHLDEGDGVVFNPTLQTTQNRKESTGARLKTAYEGEAFDLNIGLTYEKQDGVCCARVFTGIEPDSLSTFARLALSRLNANGIEIGLENRLTIGEGPLFDNTETYYGYAEAIWQLDNGHQIKSVTGFRDWEQEDANDVDAVDINIIDGGLTHELTMFSQELQFLSPTDGPLEYILGLYYYTTENKETTYLSGFEDVVGVRLRDDWRTTAEVENIAAFGHTSYKFNDRWTGFVGARLLHEKQTVDGKRTGGFVFPGDFPPVKDSISDSDWMGKIGVQFFPSDNTMFYGSYSRGYKGGHIDNTIGSVFFTGDTVTPQVKPETVDSFEIGAKTSTLDNRVRLSATLFSSEFQDFQASAFDGNANSFVFKNAGVVTTEGLEFEVAASLWEGGSVNFSLAYIDAKFDEFVGAPCPIPQVTAGTCNPAGGGQDLSGQSINNSPKLRYVISGEQNFNIGSVAGYFRAEYAFRDNTIFDGDLDPNTAIDSYGLLGARLAFMLTENLEVAAWGRNLTDEYYFLRIIDAPLESGLYSGHPGWERELGLELTVRF